MSFSNIQPEPETQVYTFQPTTSDGRAIGAPVAIEYNTEAELREKLNTTTRRMKFITTSKTITAPEGAPKYKQASSEDAQALQVHRDVQTFLETTPGYFACDHNFQAICQWIDQNNLQPCLENFRTAYSALASAGLLIDAKGRPTISADTSGVEYTTRDGRVLYGKKALDAMPADVYKRKLVNEFGFADRVERLLAGK